MKTLNQICFILAFLFCLIISTEHLNAQISQWTSKGIGGGGALFSPSLSAHDPNVIYMACDMSELFKTTDLGNSWNEVDYFEMQGNNGSKVQYTNDPDIMYCINNELDLLTPYKTTNSGASWNPLGSDPTFGEAYSLNSDHTNSSRLLVSSYTNLYFSSNGGSTFSSKYSNASGCYVAGAFFDGNNIYVGLGNGLLVSTNSGSTFALSSVTGIPVSEAIVSFSGAKQNGVTRFFCVTIPSADIYPGITGADFGYYQKIYTLDWGQPAWVQRISGIAAGHYPFFMVTSKNSINYAYVGGGSDAGSPIVYRTTNAGVSWISVLLTVNNQNIITGWSGHGGDRGWSYGEYVLGMDCSPVDSSKVIITDLGFPHLTTNAGSSWRQLYVNASDQNPVNTTTPQKKYYRGIGLENTSCWWLTWANANNINAGYSDIRGTRSTDGGNYWAFDYSGNTYNSMYQSLKHPVNGNLYAAVSSVHDMYQSTYLTDARINGGTGEVLYSTNNGANWQSLENFGRPVISLALDPNNMNRMYASVIHSSTGGIYVSSDIQNGGASVWTKLTNPPRTEGHPFNIKVLNDGTLLCSYSGRRTTVFTASSGIFISTNSGTSWIDRSASGMLYWTKDVIVDPHDANQNTWYGCVYSGWGGPPNGLGGLYKTTNRGLNWTKINSLDRVGSCTISPVNPDEMYLATEVDGLWYSNNINSATPTFTRVSGYKFRHPERIFYNPYNTNEVWVTSFGNGLKVGYINPPAVRLSLTAGIEGFRNGSVQVADTMKIYLRNSSAPYNIVDSARSVLNSSGNGLFDFSHATSGNYFIQTSHRNALNTWSATSLSFTSGVTTSFNFTESASKAFGSNQISVEGTWCLYSGDLDRNESIQLLDITKAYNDASDFISGYNISDVTGDDQTNLNDLIIIYNNSSSFVQTIHP